MADDTQIHWRSERFSLGAMGFKEQVLNLYLLPSTPNVHYRTADRQLPSRENLLRPAGGASGTSLDSGERG